MDMKARSNNHISCHLSPEYVNKINNLTGTFCYCRVREVVPENGKASVTKCIFI